MPSAQTELTVSEAMARAVEFFNDKEFDGAAELCHMVLAAQQENHDAWYLLAVMEYERGGYESALSYIDKALKINNEADQSHLIRGLILINGQQFDEAVREFKSIPHLSPQQAEVLGKLAERYLSQHDFHKVIQLSEIIQIEHSLPVQFLNNLAGCYHGVGKVNQAISLYEQLIVTAPTYITAYGNLLHLYQKNRRLDDILRVCRAGLKVEPGNGHFLSTMEYSKNFGCNWRQPDNLSDEQLEELASGDDLVAPFTLMTFPASTNRQQQLCAIKKAQHESVSTDKMFTHSPPVPDTASTENKRRLKIGYLSGDYREHVCARCISGILELHDRDKVEIFAYSTGMADDSDIRRRVIEGCDHFNDVSQNYSDQQLADKIYNDGIDILINLSGYTHFTRDAMVSMKPAPIQVNYMGFPGTMGAEYMDYIIVDPVVVPTEQEEFFTEKLVTMPNSYLINSSLQFPVTSELSNKVSRKVSRKDYGLPEQAFVFCCFNSTYKITPEMFEIWCRFLKEVSASVLWLPPTNDRIRATLEKEAERKGVQSDRLIFASFEESYEKHLNKYQVADLFLDTLPYNAHATAIDALWAGCPVVTCCGNTFASRVAGSLLTSIGLTELITKSLEEYEELVLRLVSKRSELALIREKLNNNRHTHPLFDNHKYVEHLESAYLEMWQRYASGDKPRSFAVDVQSGVGT